jgi:membrane protein
VDRIRATRPLRALTRYSTTRGGVLAAGIAYYALFAIVPLLIVAFTVLGLVVGQDRQAQSEIADWVNRGLGKTLIGTAPGQGLVRLDDLTRGELLTFTGAIGLFALLLTGLGWVGATRQGLRAVFGLPVRGNPVKARLRDLGTSVLLGGAVLASGFVGITVPTATDAILDGLGPAHTAWTSAAVRTTTFLLVWAIDSGLALILLRLLSGVRVPVDDLIGGAVTAGLGLGALKLGGGLLLGGLSKDVYLATSSVLVGLLVWADLTARLLLLCAAWSATTAEDRGHLPPLVLECPEESLLVPRPEPSPRAENTINVAAGAVLGATAVTAAWVVTRAVGQIRSALRY